MTYAINLLLSGTITQRRPQQTRQEATTDPAPLKEAEDFRLSSHFLNSGQTALPMDSMGRFWTGENVFSSGNLKLDLLHNFFLECGARAGKIRVYESTDNPTARAAVGYLLVRGGVHVVAYAKALEVLTGANVGAVLPIPDVSNKKFPEARKLEEGEGLAHDHVPPEQGLHATRQNLERAAPRGWQAAGCHRRDAQGLSRARSRHGTATCGTLATSTRR